MSSSSQPYFDVKVPAGSVEASVGIARFANESPGFQGIHKQRYSDFVVREVGKDGRVCRLVEMTGKELESRVFPAVVPEATTESLVVEDLLEELRSAASALAEQTGGISETDLGHLSHFLTQCLERDPECPPHFVSALRCNDKAVRTSLHQLFRKHASKYVDTDTVKLDESSFIRLVAKNRGKGGGGGGGGGGGAGAKGGGGGGDRQAYYQQRRPPSQTWPAGLGDYLQFTLCKENVDTMSAVNFLGKLLHVKQGGIEYAGTKDKRAVTAQTCTIYRKRPSELVRINRTFTPYLLRVGDFAYVSSPAKLGDLGGNRFGITLRALNQEDSVVLEACRALERSGFINYFGLQRFGQGSGSSKSHDIGRAVYKGAWRAAVDMMFAPREGERGEMREVKELYAKQLFQEAARKAPMQMYGERCILEGLHDRPNDFSAAFSRLPKLTRLICCHAYQSYLWNMAASKRVAEFGMQCVEGDLVAVGPAGDEAADDFCCEDVEHEQEVQGSEEKAEGGEAAAPAAQVGGDAFQSAKNKVVGAVRLVTRQEAEANVFSIRDVVLPLVGSDILLPTNSIGSFYEHLLASEGLSMQNFSSCAQTYRTSGAYRRLLQFAKDLHWEVVRYDNPNAELAVTELTAARQRPGAPPVAAEVTDLGHLRALTLNFTLPPGTYATMLLRELTKECTETQFQAQLTAQEGGQRKTDGRGGDEETHEGKKARTEDNP